LKSGRYQPYPEYCDLKNDELSIVPTGWVVKKLKWEITAKSGTDEKSENGQYVLYGANGPIGKSNTSSTKNDTVLVGRVGSAGAVNFVSDAVGVSDNALMVENYYSNSPRFDFYLLQFLNFDEDISKNAQPLITASAIRDRKVMAPRSTSERIAISGFLDYETAKIDTLIDKQQQLIKLLKEKRQAVISHAVTKGLNPDAVMKNSGVEWLGEVPEHWDVCKLKHIINALESGVSVNAADTPAQENEKGVLKTSCVYTRSFRSEENKTVFKEEEGRLKCPVRKGAIIISRMNTPDLVGASALVEDDSPNIYLPDRLWQTDFANNDRQNPKYVAFFMMLQGFRNQISLAAEGASSSMQNIAKGDYLSINIVLPEINEQNSIVSYVESKLQTFGILEGQADKAIKLLQERRTALISAAVTGKIDVRNWQPAQAEIPREASA